MALAVKDALEAITPDLPKAIKNAKGNIDSAVRRAAGGVQPQPWKATECDVVASYHIARLIRNAYAHQGKRILIAICNKGLAG